MRQMQLRGRGQGGLAVAKNDHHVIVYRILLYLYACLKGGEDVGPKRLDEIALAAGANERYWHYILCSLLDYGFISGVIRVEADNAFDRVCGLDGACITPRGIEYLTDNAFMEKAKRFLKDAEDIIPFI